MAAFGVDSCRPTGKPDRATVGGSGGASAPHAPRPRSWLWSGDGSRAAAFSRVSRVLGRPT